MEAQLNIITHTQQIINKDLKCLKNYFELFKENSKKIEALHIESQKFTKCCSDRSEICHIWETFINLVTKLKKLICTDRNGNWITRCSRAYVSFQRVRYYYLPVFWVVIFRKNAAFTKRTPRHLS